MKVEDILSSGLVNTDTEIVIGISGERTYCKKRWFSETLLKRECGKI